MRIFGAQIARHGVLKLRRSEQACKRDEVSSSSEIMQRRKTKTVHMQERKMSATNILLKINDTYVSRTFRRRHN